uniref:Hyphal_reg_CWP domain-containing protein n=1 Tax=Caenorhabditis tropicalis TaxID=1561998 RepID=A0A1I7T296_9PELO
MLSTILLSSILFSMASATGHLRLELTASNDFYLELRTNFNSKTMRMIMGSTRVTGFHPKIDEPSLEVSFSKSGASILRHVYEMRSPGEVTRQTFVLDEIVLLVSSKFECDDGFIGETCQEISTTSTTTLAPTPTTPVPTSTVRVPPQRQVQVQENQPPTNFFLCSTLIIVIIVLLILILIVFLAMRPRQQRIYIHPQPGTPVKSCKIILEDSGYQSPESSRYTASPTRSVTITL